MAKKAKPTHSPAGDYSVGYARPPVHGRIQPGEVRNPLGVNGKKSRVEDPFEEVRSKLTRVTIDGETVMMPSDLAFYMSQMAKALAGDKHAARIMAQEFAARRRMVPMRDPEEEAKEMAERKALSAKLVGLLEEAAARKKRQSTTTRYGGTSIEELRAITAAKGNKITD